MASHADKRALLKSAVALAKASTRTYIGITYDKQYAPHRNKFVLLAPGGDIAWDYSKVRAPWQLTAPPAAA